MLQVKEFSYLKDHTDIRLNISLHALAERGSRFFLYLLSPEDSSAGSVQLQKAKHHNQLQSLYASGKVLFWFSVALTFSVLISNMA